MMDAHLLPPTRSSDVGPGRDVPSSRRRYCERRTTGASSHPSSRSSETICGSHLPSGASFERPSRTHPIAWSNHETTGTSHDVTARNYETTWRNYDTTWRNDETTWRNDETTWRNHHTTWRSYDTTWRNYDTTWRNSETTWRSHPTG
jgi:hypothetical protein